MKVKDVKLHMPLNIEVRTLSATTYFIAAPYVIVDSTYGKMMRIVTLSGEISSIREDEIVSLDVAKLDAVDKKNLTSLSKMCLKEIQMKEKHKKLEADLKESIASMQKDLATQFEAMDTDAFVEEMNSVLTNAFGNTVGVGFYKKKLGEEFVLIRDSKVIDDPYGLITDGEDDRKTINTGHLDYKKAVAEFAPTELKKLAKITSSISAGISIVNDQMVAERIYSVPMKDGLSKNAIKKFKMAIA